MLSLLCREYGWKPDYILNELTWSQVWMFHEHAQAWILGKDVDYDEEPPPLEMPDVKIDENGCRVYSK
jgi:hypothetical protein